ncbi:MAG: RluA family pseudouridine synthase [Candidatus Marinimicrobia bacterium]|nr:RluA family pseudouridine synthase [Candidatus Neomarinimicrobiota bacterium]
MNLKDLLYQETVETQTFKIVVPKKTKLMRIDVFITTQISGISRTKVQELIERNLIIRNDENIKKPSTKIKKDDIITVKIPRLKRLQVEPENIPLDFIYEDDDLIVINKPPGLVVHPGVGNRTGTLVNALAHHCTTLSNVGGEYRPGIVHRLDKNTSGIIIAAKNNIAHNLMAKKFEKREINKHYLALVWGKLKEKSGKIINKIGRSKSNRQKFTVVSNGSERGKYAETHYEVLEEYEFMSLVKIRIITGRTHQIRVHFSNINHPILGDTDYGGRIKRLKTLNPRHRKIAIEVMDNIKRQALHSYQMEFTYPTTDKIMKLTAPIPDDIKNVISIMKKELK